MQASHSIGLQGEVVRCKWTLAVVHLLHAAPKRFSQLARELGVSNKVLSEKLRNLTKLGLARKDGELRYTLTEEGKALAQLIREILPPSLDPLTLGEVLKCKWMREILMTLLGSSLRASELLNSLDGLSRKVLMERLRKLERLGLIRKLQGHSSSPEPPRYALTGSGIILASNLRNHTHGFPAQLVTHAPSRRQ